MSNNYVSIVFFHNVESFVLLFILIFYNKKACLSVFDETTTYSTAMCDMSLEREFHYHYIIIIILDRFGEHPLSGQNLKCVPMFLLLTSHFMFWTYQGLKKTFSIIHVRRKHFTPAIFKFAILFY